MCKCQPDAAIWADFQRLLFDRYPIAVEFIRRQRRVRRALDTEWEKLRLKSDNEIRNYLEGCAFICPLELQLQESRLLAEHVGALEETGEPCYFFRKFIPYFGNEDLWELFVGSSAAVEVPGEVYNGELVLCVNETTTEAAETYFAEIIDAARGHIKRQLPEINAFHQRLPSFLHEAICRRRFEEIRERSKPIPGIPHLRLIT